MPPHILTPALGMPFSIFFKIWLKCHLLWADSTDLQSEVNAPPLCFHLILSCFSPSTCQTADLPGPHSWHVNTSWGHETCLIWPSSPIIQQGLPPNRYAITVCCWNDRNSLYGPRFYNLNTELLYFFLNISPMKLFLQATAVVHFTHTVRLKHRKSLLPSTPSSF